MNKLLFLYFLSFLCINAQAQETISIGELHPKLGGYVFSISRDGKHGLVAAEKDLGKFSWSDAEKKADASKSGGFEDWRLPTKDALNLMYENLHKKGLGGFSREWYWSSTEGIVDSSRFGVWLQNFGDGYQFAVYKSTPYYVRAIRAF